MRLSLADEGLTFGTNRSAGVCVHFRDPVPSPLRRKGHPALTVTVADVDGLMRSLSATPNGPTHPRNPDGLTRSPPQLMA